MTIVVVTLIKGDVMIVHRKVDICEDGEDYWWEDIEIPTPNRNTY